MSPHIVFLKFLIFYVIYQGHITSHIKCEFRFLTFVKTNDQFEEVREPRIFSFLKRFPIRFCPHNFKSPTRDSVERCYFLQKRHANQLFSALIAKLFFKNYPL